MMMLIDVNYEAIKRKDGMTTVMVNGIGFRGADHISKNARLAVAVKVLEKVTIDFRVSCPEDEQVQDTAKKIEDFISYLLLDSTLSRTDK